MLGMVHVACSVTMRQAQSTIYNLQSAIAIGSVAMSKPMQVYYSAMLGALGGLLGWWSVGAVPTGAWNVWLAYPLVGAGLGLWIGGCVTATDGAVVKRSARRALRDGLR